MTSALKKINIKLINLLQIFVWMVVVMQFIGCKEDVRYIKKNSFIQPQKPQFNWSVIGNKDSVVKVRFLFTDSGSRLVNKIEFEYFEDSLFTLNKKYVILKPIIDKPLEMEISGLQRIKKYWGRVVISSDIDTFHYNLQSLSREQTFPTNGLVAWLPFNGNSNDESGNGNNGKVSGGVSLTVDRFGNTNSAYFFDGINSANTGIEVPILLKGGSSFAISCWFRSADSTKVAQTLFVGWPYQSIALGLNHPYFNNRMGSCLGNGGWQICSSGMQTSWNYGNKHDWHHIVLQYNSVSKTTSFYLDGVQVKNVNHAFFFPQLISLSFGGQLQQAPGEVFRGQLDDIAVWNKVLSDQEILDVFQY